jgi:hypothetical protein
MTESNHLTQSKMTSPLPRTHRSIFNRMICCELGRVGIWNRFRSSRRARWCKHRHYLVTGACSGELDCGGARRSTVLASYDGPNDATEGSKDAQDHRGADRLLVGADCWQRWAWFRRFRRGAAEGNGRIRPTSALSAQFLQHTWS